MDQGIAILGTELGADVVMTDPDVMDAFRRDRAMTIEPGHPLAVVRARGTADVATTLRIADEHRIPVVTRGAGTGLSGGAAAIDGSITLSTRAMTDIDIDPGAMIATVRPGALNAEVKAAAAEHGLWYPPDPSSFEICSIGGNLATNAGGLCCVRYGVTTDYVLGMEVVLAGGRVLRLGGTTVKDVAGLDLKRLFVGSEGTLGVMTEASLRLRSMPPPVSTVVATFPDTVAAGRAVTRIMSSVRPSVLELMDGAAVAAVDRVKSMGLEDVGALLLAQTDVGSPDAAAMARDVETEGATYVAVTDDADEGDMFMAARRMAIPCVERLGTVLIEDVGVPIPRIPDLLGAVASVAERHGTAIPVIGHAGDGNFHPLVTFDPQDASARQRAASAFDDVMTAALDLGGTITGEHGVGSLKVRHLGEQLGPDVSAVSRSIKLALDPNDILNPGKWL
ncbi:MAG: FAD-linked oxidase C-terminal domain-containing protein [Acidimicrobiales bacterium]|nr:FAD-linked oxidase C-terminal domain-containing protein [Acidimicrobiales bacterium]